MTFDLWDNIPEATEQTHEAAKSKRPQPYDAQPTQQRMRGQIKPGNRRNISAEEKRVRRQMAQQNPKTAGIPFDQRPQRYRDGWQAAMSDQSHNGTFGLANYTLSSDSDFAEGYYDGWDAFDAEAAGGPIHESSKTDSTTTQKETMMDSSTFAQEEAALLQRMASARTAFEQDQARADLDSLRNARRDQIATEGSLDYEAAISYQGGDAFGGLDGLAPLTPAQASLGRTASVTSTSAASGDWLDDIETMETTSAVDRDHAMRTEATLWYEQVHPVVKEDRELFSREAQSMAVLAGNQFLENAPAAVAAFLDAVDHIHTHAGYSSIKQGEWAGFDPMKVAPATDLQTGDHGYGSGSSLPAGVSPSQAPQTADGLVNGDLDNASGVTDQKSTDSDKAPSLQHGSAPDTGSAPSGPENPIAFDKTLDHSTQPGPDNYMSIDGYPSGGRKAGGLQTQVTHTAGEYQGGSPKSGDTSDCHADGQPIQFFDGAWYHLKGGPSHNDVYPPTPKERAEKAKQSSLDPEQAMHSLASSGRAITSANEWGQHTADASPTDYPNASGHPDPQAPEAYGEAPSMDHGSSPDSDTSATPGQVADNTGADGDLDKANTPQNPDYVPTGGSPGGAASGGPMAGTPTASLHTAVTDTCVHCGAQIHRDAKGVWEDNSGGDVCGSYGTYENEPHVPSYDETKESSLRGVASRLTQMQVSANARTFAEALAQCTDLDASFGGVTGHQMVAFVQADPSVPVQVKEALTQAQAGGVAPFAREGGLPIEDSGYLTDLSKGQDPTPSQEYWRGVVDGEMAAKNPEQMAAQTPEWIAQQSPQYQQGREEGLAGTVASKRVVPPFAREAGSYARPPQGNPDLGWVEDKRVSPEEAEFRRVFPNGVPLHGDLTEEQQRVLKMRGSHTASGETMPPGSVRITPKDSQNSPGLINVVQVWSPMTAQTVYSGYDYLKAKAVATEAVAKAKAGEWASECKDARIFDQTGETGTERPQQGLTSSLHMAAGSFDTVADAVRHINETGKGKGANISDVAYLMGIDTAKAKRQIEHAVQQGHIVRSQPAGKNLFHPDHAPKTGSRTAATPAGWWPRNRDSERFPGEKTLGCPKCGGPVRMEGFHGPGGRLGDPGGGTTLRCTNCGHAESFHHEAAGRGDTFSIEDAKNEDGEWTMSPEQIRAEMAYDPYEDSDPYDDDRYASLHTAAAWSAGDKVQRDGKTYTIISITPAGTNGTRVSDGPVYHARLDGGNGYSVDIWSGSMSNPTSAFTTAPENEDDSMPSRPEGYHGSRTSNQTLANIAAAFSS